MRRTLTLLMFLSILGLGCGDDPPVCGPSNCNGCCTSNGTCVAGNTDAVCGYSGGTCSTCSSVEKCVSGTCTVQTQPCGPANCATGCCVGNVCKAGNENSFCGAGGGLCTNCASSDVCSAGKCAKKPCDATTCPNGCCYQGSCLPGTNPGACGKGGAACQDCGNGMTCQQQTCTKQSCDATTCGSGCCDTNGNCITTLTEANCGTGGALCQQCGKEQICQSGVCGTPSCSPTNCPTGCCDDTGKCVTGTAMTACGTGGTSCSKCETGQICQSNKCTCTTAACPSGCCLNDKCQPGTTNAACGAGGNNCNACKSNEKCDKGACAVGCGLNNCKDGCCDGITCKKPSNTSFCGLLGQPCQKCNLTSFSEKCLNGICNDSAKCGSAQCPKGCCKNSKCEPCNNFNTCGKGGQVCQVCPPHMQCVNQACAIKPTGKWMVTLVEAEVDSAKKWDTGLVLPGYEPPDVSVELTVSAQTKKSKTKDNTYKPVWNEYLLTATAAELMQSNNFTIKVWDEELIGPPQKIAECTTQIFEFELKAGQAKILYCGTGKDLKRIMFNFAPAP